MATAVTVAFSTASVQAALDDSANSGTFLSSVRKGDQVILIFR